MPRWGPAERGRGRIKKMAKNRVFDLKDPADNAEYEELLQNISEGKCEMIGFKDKDDKSGRTWNRMVSWFENKLMTAEQVEEDLDREEPGFDPIAAGTKVVLDSSELEILDDDEDDD
jgi:hypothetical protein